MDTKIRYSQLISEPNTSSKSNGSLILPGADGFSIPGGQIGRNIVIQIGSGELMHFRSNGKGTLTQQLPTSAINYLRSSPNRQVFIQRLADVSAQFGFTVKSAVTDSPTENSAMGLMNNARAKHWAAESKKNFTEPVNSLGTQTSKRAKGKHQLNQSLKEATKKGYVENKSKA
jgi:hypothetical protein